LEAAGILLQGFRDKAMSEDVKDYSSRNDRVYRECIGVVETEGKDDPRKLLLVQVRVYGVFDNVPVKDLPWAQYKLPVGARANDGSVTPVKKGDIVYVSFPFNGDTRRPVITGSVHYAPDSVPNLPHETFAGPDAYQHQRTGEEPEQPAHAYGEDAVATQNGIMIAVNKDGSFNVVQKGTGTEVTFTKDGDLVVHVSGSIFRSATGDSKSVIDGAEKILIMGEQETIAQGGITHDGGTGATKGVVQGDCIDPFTGKPHPHISSNVKASV